MRIVVISSHTKSLFWFRLDMMKEFIAHGHDVIALGDGTKEEWADEFTKVGIKYRQIKVWRNSLNPVKDLLTLIDLFKILREEKPDRVFAYQAKSIVYGSIAAKLSNVKGIYILIAGLGSLIRQDKVKINLAKIVILFEYWLAGRICSGIIFQNDDDRSLLIKKRIISANKTELINGSGVNLERFTKAPLPPNTAFLFIGRLIKDKGLLEYLEACRIIKSMNSTVRCLLVGPFDSNPSAIKPDDLKPYIDNNIIEFFGEQDDVRPFISQCCVFILPSYHEGTPKTVLEAMAMGRPIITTNAPGCKETVSEGINGFLIPINNVDAIVDKMQLFIKNPHLAKQLGDASAEIAAERFDVRKVNAKILSIMQIT